MNRSGIMNLQIPIFRNIHDSGIDVDILCLNMDIRQVVLCRLIIC